MLDGFIKSKSNYFWISYLMCTSSYSWKLLHGYLISQVSSSMLSLCVNKSGFSPGISIHAKISLNSFNRLMSACFSSTDKLALLKWVASFLSSARLISSQFVALILRTVFRTSSIICILSFLNCKTFKILRLPPFLQTVIRYRGSAIRQLDLLK